jgi:hypothetical protein
MVNNVPLITPDNIAIMIEPCFFAHFREKAKKRLDVKVSTCLLRANCLPRSAHALYSPVSTCFTLHATMFPLQKKAQLLGHPHIEKA